MVMRLGAANNVQVVNSQRYRVLQGQALTVLSVALTGVTLRAWARVRYDNGEDGLLIAPDQALIADGTVNIGTSSEVARMDGWVTDALGEVTDADIQRGQVYVKLSLEPWGPVLFSDYVFSDFGQVALGTFVPPGEGRGYLNMVTVVSDTAPVSTTYALDRTKTIRKILGFSIQYVTSSDVASRTIKPELKGYLGDPPTGMDDGDRNVWEATTLTLTADADGSSFADTQRAGKNTDDVIAIDNTASAPSPFPLLVTDVMDMDLFFRLGSPHANDLQSIYVFTEDWATL